MIERGLTSSKRRTRQPQRWGEHLDLRRASGICNVPFSCPFRAYLDHVNVCRITACSLFRVHAMPFSADTRIFLRPLLFETYQRLILMSAGSPSRAVGDAAARIAKSWCGGMRPCGSGHAAPRPFHDSCRIFAKARPQVARDELSYVDVQPTACVVCCVPYSPRFRVFRRDGAEREPPSRPTCEWPVASSNAGTSPRETSLRAARCCCQEQ